MIRRASARVKRHLDSSNAADSLVNMSNLRDERNAGFQKLNDTIKNDSVAREIEEITFKKYGYAMDVYDAEIDTRCLFLATSGKLLNGLRTGEISVADMYKRGYKH